jgi:sugar phosphate isomerase/epimerase
MKTLVQLYSARNFKPWEGVLDLVAKNGFDGVEGFFENFSEPAAFRSVLEARGLAMPQAHVPLSLLEDDFENAVSIAKGLGVETLIGPWLAPEERPTDAAGWQSLGERLRKIAGKLQDLGFGFAWHNHDFELAPLPDGQTGMDVLLATAPSMDWEADLGWVVRAGGDPVIWLEKYAVRIIAVHIKDIQPNADVAPEDGWADLGHGITDWKPIFAKLATLPRLRARVAEHDNPADLARFLSRWKASDDLLSR